MLHRTSPEESRLFASMATIGLTDIVVLHCRDAFFFCIFFVVCQHHCYKRIVVCAHTRTLTPYHMPLIFKYPSVLG